MPIWLALFFVIGAGFTEQKSNWVTISYDGLVDKSVLTHSGKAVGVIIQEIPKDKDDFKGLVQPYLEPYSILCHDVLLTTTGPDTPPLVNILAHYPIGSEQPAWVDLFREGHFQLYYNAHLIRIFLKGANPKNSFEKYHSVIRHSIQDVIKSMDTSIDNLEVYVFSNDYANAEMRLNTIPHVYNIADLNLSPKRKSMDLSSIEYLLGQGVILEAVEVDANNDLYFYGKKASKQTLAGHPVSLADIAVIYRSFFHYGNNSPYISLDKHEDNRYAKVNFGGHLENTHTGNVLLEADKLFKLLSTGIDPNTHKLAKSKITKYVPNFLTEDERLFLDGGVKSHTQIRYWFYPDSIGTVTDGAIGAILKHQFIAEAERMKIRVSVSNATKKTIDHLNQNLSQYEKAENTFKELSTVGRIMALVNWLKEMNMDDRIELDDLLSVRIPSFTTPKRTKKMLAVSSLGFSSNSNLTSRYVSDYTKVYYISHLLDQHKSSASDNDFLETANDFFSQIDISELAPPQQRKQKNMKFSLKYSFSINGGINLSPSEFKQVSRDINSPRLQEVIKIKSKVKTAGKIAQSGDWVRNNSEKGELRTNKLPVSSWTSSKSVQGDAENGNIVYSFHSNSADDASVTLSRDLKEWQSNTSVNGSQDMVKYSQKKNLLEVKHAGFSDLFKGDVSPDGKRFVFHK